MSFTKNHVYTVAILAALIAAYLLFTAIRPPQLAFADRASPPGFRDLMLERFVSQPNPIFGAAEMARAGATSKPDTKDICDALLRDPNSPSAGNKNAAVPLVTFFDYRCPYCKTLAAIMSAMRFDNVRVVFHEWAILGEPSVLAARAALAADRQGKYLALHTRLMNARLLPTPTYIDAIAAELGINLTQFHTDMTSQSVTLALQRTAALASALGLIGTPALVVGRTVVQGEISRSQLERLIEEELRPAAAKAC